MTTNEKLEKYLTYSFLFYWAAQINSVGKISGNLTSCTNQTEKWAVKVDEIYYQYKNKSFAEAGRSTYHVLKTIDPIVFACYFATIEYKYAIEIYVNTL